MKPKRKVEAVAYMRTSSAADLVEGKDSEKRQRQAIERYASRAGYEIVDWYYDERVPGADPVESRPGFVRGELLPARAEAKSDIKPTAVPQGVPPRRIFEASEKGSHGR